MKIVFTGGGTMGSVSPLLAAGEQLGEHDLYFIGTKNGPERESVERAGMQFTAITSTKVRRYLTIRHLLVPFQLALGKWQAFWALGRIKPDVIVSAGGFVDVPVIWMGWLRRIPSVIHQQDIHPGFAIKLMAPFARTITVAFEESLKDFPKARWIGNPVRDLTPTTDEFQIDAEVPTVMIMGGGTGAQAINELVTTKLCEQMNVIHVTGRGRQGKMEKIDHPRYHKREFLGEEMKEALHKADVVVSRAGLGSITELSTLGKPAIIIPMPNSHQEKNAQLLAQAHAAIVLQQQTLNTHTFYQAIQELLENEKEQLRLSQGLQHLMPTHATKKCIEVILAAGNY
jgi:UDP-N-acetylglucosamine--N-acetylmuramyl-(pentapeptide) pyrophosphoryl-undecaprenol N-acetylglucosamine transferase